MHKLIGAAIAAVLLAACGGSPRLDATNVETFKTSLAEMVADMPEADRRSLAQDIYVIVRSRSDQRVSPNELYIHNYEQFLGSGSTSFFGGGGFAQIVLNAGDQLDKKTAEQIKRSAVQARSEIYLSWIAELEAIKQSRLNWIPKYMEDMATINESLTEVQSRIASSDRAIREAVSNLVVVNHEAGRRDFANAVTVTGRIDLKNTIASFHADSQTPICGARLKIDILTGGHSSPVSGTTDISVDALAPGEKSTADFSVTVSGWYIGGFRSVPSYSLASFKTCDGGSVSIDTTGNQRYVQDTERKLQRCSSTLLSAQGDVRVLEAAIERLVPLSKAPEEAEIELPRLTLWDQLPPEARSVCN